MLDKYYLSIPISGSCRPLVHTRYRLFRRVVGTRSFLCCRDGKSGKTPYAIESACASRHCREYPEIDIEIQSSYRVFCIVGDGELNEGQNWEAMMFAAKYKLDNLVCIVDYNKFQLDGPVEMIMPIEPLADKFKAFGWDSSKLTAIA